MLSILFDKSEGKREGFMFLNPTRYRTQTSGPVVGAFFTLEPADFHQAFTKMFFSFSAFIKINLISGWTSPQAKQTD